MKAYKAFHLLIVVIAISLSTAGQSTLKISPKDLKTLNGHWHGSLTYLDYTTNKPFTMAADLQVSQLRRTNRFLFANLYPKEPNANSVDTITISKDGSLLNDEQVVSKRRLDDGSLEIITEISGMDGNDHKAAVIRHTYIISKNQFINTKEVKFTGQTAWIKRHEFNYRRS